MTAGPMIFSLQRKWIPFDLPSCTRSVCIVDVIVCVVWICWHYNNTHYVFQLYYNCVVVQFATSVHVRKLSQIMPLFLAFAGNLRPSPLKTGYSYTYLHCKRELEDIPHLTYVRW